MLIRSFRSSDTEKLFKGERVARFRNIERVALRRLFQLHSAKTLSDLRGVGNSLEILAKDRSGQHAIRINQQYRICFIWKHGDVYQVEITDYH